MESSSLVALGPETETKLYINLKTLFLRGAGLKLHGIAKRPERFLLCASLLPCTLQG